MDENTVIALLVIGTVLSIALLVGFFQLVGLVRSIDRRLAQAAGEDVEGRPSWWARPMS
jgi:hypothetical protein